MSGKRYFLDTNAIVQLLAGNSDLIKMLSGASYVATSVICVLEFTCFSGLTAKDKRLFQTFLKRVDVVDLCSDDKALMETITSLRSSTKLKLPDSIIVASSACHSCVLLTADSRLLTLANISTQTYSLS